MSDEMIERVAKALGTDQMRKALAQAGLEYEPAQEVFLRKYALIAVQAMREPTEAMKDGAGRATGYEETAIIIWQSMIDAALP